MNNVLGNILLGAVLIGTLFIIGIHVALYLLQKKCEDECGDE